MNADELRRNRDYVDMYLKSTLQIIEDKLFDEEQKQIFIDAQFSIMGFFDAEISYLENTCRKALQYDNEKNSKNYYQYFLNCF